MKTLLTFGDSNTWGALPIEYEGQRRRLGPDARWPGVAKNILGEDWTLIEEGLPGRTTRHEDPEMGRHMDGSLGLPIALQSHGPIDVMTLLLGTNDLKHRFDVSAEEIANSVDQLVQFALSDEIQQRHDGFSILLICPPPIFEVGVISDQFTGGAEKSKHLAGHMKSLAEAHGLGFLDAGTEIESSRVDGIHFGENEHLVLGKAIAASVRMLT